MSLQVAAEIEAKVREEAAARGLSVESVINEALRLFGDQGVTHGPDGKVVFETARKRVEAPFLEFVEEPGSTPFVGGWL